MKRNDMEAKYHVISDVAIGTRYVEGIVSEFYLAQYVPVCS